MLKCQERVLNNFMSEQDLNQAKSKGGSLSFKSVRAVSALCSLSMKFRKHLRVTIEKKEKKWDCREHGNARTFCAHKHKQCVTLTHAGVCDAHLACDCRGASPAARGPSSGESHAWKRHWQLHDENLMGDKGEGDKGARSPF